MYDSFLKCSINVNKNGLITHFKRIFGSSYILCGENKPFQIRQLEPGNIPIERIKYGPIILLEHKGDIFNDSLVKGKDLPDDWNISHISSIYRKGNSTANGKYRGISITSSIVRLYGKILKERIELELKGMEQQSGFIAGRSCLDNIFTLQQVIEKIFPGNLSTYLLFIDLEKAYDSVALIKMFNTLTNVGLSEQKYIRAISNI